MLSFDRLGEPTYLPPILPDSSLTLIFNSNVLLAEMRSWTTVSYQDIAAGSPLSDSNYGIKLITNLCHCHTSGGWFFRCKLSKNSLTIFWAGGAHFLLLYLNCRCFILAFFTLIFVYYKHYWGLKIWSPPCTNFIVEYLLVRYRSPNSNEIYLPKHYPLQCITIIYHENSPQLVTPSNARRTITSAC